MNGVRTTTALYVYDAAGDLPEEFRPAAESETKYGTADALGSTPGTLTYCYDGCSPLPFE